MQHQLQMERGPETGCVGCIHKVSLSPAPRRQVRLQVLRHGRQFLREDRDAGVVTDGRAAGLGNRLLVRNPAIPPPDEEEPRDAVDARAAAGEMLVVRALRTNVRPAFRFGLGRASVSRSTRSRAASL